MLGSCLKNLFLYDLTVITRTPSTSFLIPSPSSPFPAPNYATVTKTLEKQSFTVNYLVENCGFLPDSALRASKYVLLKSPEKPDSVIALFRSFGFTDLQFHNVIRRSPKVLVSKPKETILPKLEFLISKGVREISMSWLIRQWPCLLVFNSEVRLKSIVDEVIKMGVDPNKANFVAALYAKFLPKSMWDKKVELYKSFGLTDDNIREAFVKHPFCMLKSVQKIEACVGFFVKELGWEPAEVTNNPVLLSLDLDKRIVPRAAVMKILISNGVIKSGRHASAYFVSEEEFFKKYVNRDKDHAPDLLTLYNEKMNLPVMDSKLMS
nr:transcription termination factor MTEF1, chloroplastic-like [Arachis hypogaea]